MCLSAIFFGKNIRDETLRAIKGSPSYQHCSSPGDKTFLSIGMIIRHKTRYILTPSTTKLLPIWGEESDEEIGDESSDRKSSLSFYHCRIECTQLGYNTLTLFLYPRVAG